MAKSDRKKKVAGKVPKGAQAAFEASRPGTILENFNNLFLSDDQLEEIQFGNKSAFKIFGKTPVQLAKRVGDPPPTGQFAETSTEQLATELLAREAGNPTFGALSGIETGDIFGELRLRNEANKPPPPPAPPGAGFRVESVELQAQNLDRLRAGLTPLAGRQPRGPGERRVARELGLDRRGSAVNVGFSRNTTLATQARATQARGGVGTITTPEGEARRKANAQPIRLGSAPSATAGRGGGLLSSFQGR
jgi:hypothetical protein